MRVAIAQATPVVLDLDASIERACSWIGRAGEAGARLVAFPETWLPTYPFWCDAGSFSTWDHPPAKRLHARLIRNSLEIPSADCDRLREAARDAGTAVVLGVNERGPSGTLYNTLLFLGPDGRILGRHRKLVPTHGERLVHGRGDAAGLRTYEVDGVKVGGLVCWEHWMPLSRHVLHAEGEQVHVAAWPHAKEMHQIASRHYAFEGRAFVLVAALYVPKRDVPADYELAEELAGAPEVLHEGGSAIVGPDGRYLVEPIRNREELIVADLDLDRIPEERLALDVAGHYARPDLFDLQVRREPLPAWREPPASDA